MPLKLLRKRDTGANITIIAIGWILSSFKPFAAMDQGMEQAASKTE